MLLQNVQTSVGAHPASYPMGTWGSFPGLKWPGREVNHSPSPNVEVTNEWSCTSNSPTCLQCMGRKHYTFTSFKKMVYENITRKCEKKSWQSSFCIHIKMMNDLSGRKQCVVFLVVHVLTKNCHAETSLIHMPSAKCFKIIWTHTSRLVTEVNTIFFTHIQSLFRV